MVGGSGSTGLSEELARDYERVARLGAKRSSDLSPSRTEGGRAAFDRLAAVGLAAEQRGAIVLRHPHDCPWPLDGHAAEQMLAWYLGWLRAGSGPGPGRSPRSGESGPAGGTDDDLLYGELGFWQHWWNRIRERDYERQGPLPMDIVIPDDGTFEVRSWLAEFDPGVRSYVLGGRLIRGRVIVPPQALRSEVEPMLDLSAESGFEVRVLSTAARFALYDERVAVLNESPGDPRERLDEHPEAYRAVHNAAIVEPLRHFFSLLWRSATPFRASRGEYEAMLDLLAKGFTDTRIARALNLSTRTVSRRVSEIMTEYGAGSRFELGMLHGRSQPGP